MELEKSLYWMFTVESFAKRMRVCCIAGLLTSVPLSAGLAESSGVMIAVVSRDQSMLTGGVSSGPQTASGTVDVEPVARLTSSGEWQDLHCSSDHPEGCAALQRDYLNTPHRYTVISAQGHGTMIDSPPIKLGDCYEFVGKGTYTGASLEGSAIATVDPELFTDSSPIHLLSRDESGPTRKALTVLVPNKLDSTKYLRIYTMHFEDLDLVLAQRTLADQETLKPVFMIGALKQGEFHVLYQGNGDDGDERLLGAIQLKNGPGYLMSGTHDSESQSFNIFGVHDGKLIKVYSGGGSSC